MDYKILNDNELVYLCSENNEEATKIIINKYKNYIYQIINEYLKECNIIGVEVSDLYQEGLIGLLNAIHTYDEHKDVLFYTYAGTCIRTSIVSAIRKTFRQKDRILNNSYSLDKIFDESENNLYEVIKDEKNEPNSLLINKENEIELLEKIRSKLSKSELEIFNLKFNGHKNEEIATIIGKDKKYVENTIFRINKKCKEIIK